MQEGSYILIIFQSGGQRGLQQFVSKRIHPWDASCWEERLMCLSEASTLPPEQ